MCLDFDLKNPRILRLMSWFLNFEMAALMAWPKGMSFTAGQFNLNHCSEINNERLSD